MKRILIRIVSLVLIFIISVFGISKFINRDNPDTTEEMAQATLPLVYMTAEGTQVNLLHGYVKEMDVSSMRDSLTPINSQRTVDIQVQPFQMNVSGISFEVVTADGKTSLENTKVTKMTEEDGYIKATLEFQNKMLINTEYMLKIHLETGNKDVYYYTRILQEDGLNTKSYLDFVNGFYERCINKNLDVLAQAIEPNDSGDNTTLAFMDIHCTAEQLGWADLNPQIYYKPIPSIKELNENTATIVLDYMISAVNDSGDTELYRVSEYYRMRYTESRVMLLDFERETREIFNPDNGVLTEKGINLGIAGKDITYKNDVQNQFFAFVQEGALWLYEVSSSKLTQVFSFPQEENSDARDTYDQNDINIINIDSSGNMYFLVCGYMNRGRHEGETGVAVYYYNAAAGSISESLFVDTMQSYSLLEQDVESLAYVTEDRERFYIALDGTVYGVDMNSRQVESIVSNLKAECYVSSGTGKQVAWLEGGEPFNGTSITVMDLDTKETRNITCGENERIRPIGFMDEDFVYGIADAGDIEAEHEGNEFFPMKAVYIVNQEGETVKTYSQDGIYVTQAVIEEKLMTLTRMKKSGDTFTEVSEDHIVNSVADEESSYGLTTILTDRKQTETILRVGKTIKTEEVPQVLRSREVIYEGSKEIVLEPKQTQEEAYYVYAKGKLDSVYTSANEAVKRADEALGVVVNSSQQIVWERGNKKTKIDLDVSTFPEAILRYDMDVDKLKASLGKEVLDLSGCTLDMVLYFVSEGTPVLAKTKDGVVIIGGYDEYNTRLLYQGKEELEYAGLNDSAAMFEEAGNIFVAYLDPLTE